MRQRNDMPASVDDHIRLPAQREDAITIAMNPKDGASDDRWLRPRQHLSHRPPQDRPIRLAKLPGQTAHVRSQSTTGTSSQRPRSVLMVS